MISIIFPTLNEEAYIGNTIKSLTSKLKAVPFEIIISDGQSKDKTVEIARSLGAKAVEYKGRARQTIAQGRNDGAAAASGDYLVFLDADCTVKDPDKFFTEALHNFEKHPKIVALCARTKVLPEMANLMDHIVFNFHNFCWYLMNNYLNMAAAPGEFQMFKRSAFDQVGGYNPVLTASEDLDIFHRLSKIGKTRVDWNLVVYHTGRRAHKIGWLKLYSQWTINSLSMIFRGKPFTKEWKPVR